MPSLAKCFSPLNANLTGCHTLMIQQDSDSFIPKFQNINANFIPSFLGKNLFRQTKIKLKANISRILSQIFRFLSQKFAHVFL